MNEVIKQAPTVDEAIELALKELGLARDQVTAEVLEYPEKKLFFKKPAKVKVSQIEDSFNVKELLADKAPAKPQQEKTAPAKEAFVKQEKPVQARTEAPLQEKEELVAIEPAQQSAKTKYAMEFIHSVIDQFYEGEYTLVPYKTQTGVIIKIKGENAGCLIGRKGETMEALSYLTSLASNRFEDSEEKVSVDVADYRQKRRQDLQQIARKMAIKVAKTGRPYTFEPMNPYDRLIVHTEVGQISGVKSESKGEGSQRRVAIYSTAPRKPRQPGDKPYPSRGGKPYNNNRGGYNKDRRDKPALPAQKTRDEKLVDNAGASLYSKIEL